MDFFRIPDKVFEVRGRETGCGSSFGFGGFLFFGKEGGAECCVASAAGTEGVC